jgi:hypothetical protein
MGNGIRVFIAGPHTYPDPEINTFKAMEAFDRLLNLGFIPFCPHLTHFIHKAYPRSYESWCEYDLKWLEKCVVLLRLPGESIGADKEVEFANDHGINVFYDIESMVRYYVIRGLL